MAKAKIIALVLLILLFSIPLVYAAPVPQLQQVVSLVETLPRSSRLRGRYSSQDIWFDYTRYAGPNLKSPFVDFETFFPVDSSNRRIAHETGFRGQPQVYQELEFREVYDLPSWDFEFNSCFTSIIYVLDLSNTADGQSDWSLSSLSVDLIRSDSVSSSYSGTVISVSTTSRRTRLLCRFDISDFELSDQITSIQFLSHFTLNTSDQPSASIVFYTNVFPFLVSSDYKGTELFTAATYSILQNQVTPSIKNIETVVTSMNDRIEQQTQQQAAIASAQSSQSAAQHSQSMAAIATLPQAQAAAELDEAEQRAQAAASSEAAKLAADVGAAESALDSVTGGFLNVENGIGTFFSTFISEDSRSGVILEFPALKIPAIRGATNRETVISDSQLLQFDDLFAKIPPTVMLLVQIVITGGMMIFLIKNVISFIRLILNKGEDPSAAADPVTLPSDGPPSATDVEMSHWRRMGY